MEKIAAFAEHINGNIEHGRLWQVGIGGENEVAVKMDSGVDGFQEEGGFVGAGELPRVRGEFVHEVQVGNDVSDDLPLGVFGL